MEYGHYHPKQCHVIRADDGEEIIEAVKKVVEETGMPGGVIVSLAGAVEDPVIINPAGDGKKPEPVETRLKGIMEIVGNGNIALDDEGRPVIHLHVSLGKSVKESYTGHLVGGKAKYFAEIVVVEFGEKMSREKHLDWKFKMLKP